MHFGSWEDGSFWSWWWWILISPFSAAASWVYSYERVMNCLECSDSILFSFTLFMLQEAQGGVLPGADRD